MEEVKIPAKRMVKKRELLNLKLSMRTIAPKLEKKKKQDLSGLKIPKFTESSESLIPSFTQYLNEQKIIRYPILKNTYIFYYKILVALQI